MYYISTVLGVMGKVVLLWADTVIRGEPIVITKENYKSFILDNKVKVNGLGGTDIIGSIHEALNNEKIKKDVLGELKVKDVVVFSDLEFYYDAKGLKIPNGISVSMIAPECVSPKLVDEAQKAMPWANVFHIGHDRTVDLRKATQEEIISNLLFYLKLFIIINTSQLLLTGIFLCYNAENINTISRI